MPRITELGRLNKNYLMRKAPEIVLSKPVRAVGKSDHQVL